MKNTFTIIKFTLIAVVISLSSTTYAQDKFHITPTGLTPQNNQDYIVISVDGATAGEIVSAIKVGIKSKNPSSALKFEEPVDNTIIISEFIPGFTKTDKTAGSAYLLDLSYSITLNIKDGKIKFNVPVFQIASNQQYDGQTVITNKGVQFVMSMGIKGKPDIWNDREKKLFIYNDKDKLIEVSTKEKLENLFNSYIELLTSVYNNNSDNW